MTAVKSKDTKPEITLGKAMWSCGLRYRKQYSLPGKPDFVFVNKRIAIFCDGDFWHGNNWKVRGLNCLEDELNKYNDYWRTKIQKNIARDSAVNEILTSSGWTVLRFWESEIKHDISKCISTIVLYYNSAK